MSDEPSPSTAGGLPKIKKPQQNPDQDLDGLSQRAREHITLDDHDRSTVTYITLIEDAKRQTDLVRVERDRALAKAEQLQRSKEDLIRLEKRYGTLVWSHRVNNVLFAVGALVLGLGEDVFGSTLGYSRAFGWAFVAGALIFWVFNVLRTRSFDQAAAGHDRP